MQALGLCQLLSIFVWESKSYSNKSQSPREHFWLDVPNTSPRCLHVPPTCCLDSFHRISPFWLFRKLYLCYSEKENNSGCIFSASFSRNANHGHNLFSLADLQIFSLSYTQYLENTSPNPHLSSALTPPPPLSSLHDGYFYLDELLSSQIQYAWT